MIRKLKWLLQKLFRGYSDLDLWGLDLHLSKLIHKRIKAFNKIKMHTYPISLKSPDEWRKILEKIEWAFFYASCDYGHDEPFGKRLYYYDDYGVMQINHYLHHEYNKRYVEGMELFALYFQGLWD